MDHARGLEILVAQADLAGDQFVADLDGFDADRQAVEQRVSGECLAAEAEQALAGLDLGLVGKADDRLAAVVGGDLQTAAVACGDDAFDLRSARGFGQVDDGLRLLLSEDDDILAAFLLRGNAGRGQQGSGGEQQARPVDGGNIAH